MNINVSIFTALIAFISALTATFITSLINFYINERKLKYESAQKDKEFYREKYEQLILKFIQLHNTLNEEYYLKITSQNNKVALAEVTQIGAEIEMLVKLYFGNLVEAFKDYSKSTAHLYTQILYGNVEETNSSYRQYSIKADYLIEMLGNNENIYEYTRKLPFN